MSFYHAGREIAGRYEIRELIGVGPVSASYLALDQVGDELVAVKLFYPELFSSEGAARRFSEALLPLCGLRHPGLVAPREVGVEGGQAFCTKAFVPGDSLRYVIRRRGRLHLAEAEGILWQLSEALRALKKRPHGGIRPENLLVLTGSVRLTDACLYAAIPPGAYVAALTQEPSACYLAPEIRGAHSRREPSRASDTFALGALLYEMLCGEPYRGVGLPMLAKSTGCPVAVDEILVRALAPKPGARYATPEEFFTQLTRIHPGGGKVLPSPREEGAARSTAGEERGRGSDLSDPAPVGPGEKPPGPALPPSEDPGAIEPGDVLLTLPLPEVPEEKPPAPPPVDSAEEEPSQSPPAPPAPEAPPDADSIDTFLELEMIEVEDADIEEESAFLEVSRIETVIPEPPSPAQDPERTRIWQGEKPGEHVDDDTTGVRSAPLSPPSVRIPLEEPGDDLFVEPPIERGEREEE